MVLTCSWSLRRYFFAPHDAVLDTEAGIFLPKRSSAVPDTEIRDTLQALRGHAMFFFDTCHAGRASGVSLKGEQDYKLFVNELRSAANSVVVLASSDGSQLSQERDSWRNGAFTEALLSGIDGRADIVGNDGVVRILELATFMEAEVKTLTGGQQFPVITILSETPNLSFVAVR